MNKLLLVDGNSLINRAFYATPLDNGATYGFLRMFLKCFVDEAATHVAVAFDLRAKTFRHQMYDQYKGTRKKMPDELAAQLADLKTVLDIMGIKHFAKEGFEADDIIGTLSRRAMATTRNGVGDTDTSDDYNVIILTSDRDLLQLVNTYVSVHLTRTGVTNTANYDNKRIADEFGGLTPDQLIDLKSLMGDKSDNIPGVAGIGEKTGIKIIREGRVADYPDAVFYRKLVQINCDVPFDANIPDLKFTLPLSRETFMAFRERKFFSLLRLDHLWQSNTPPPPTATQLSFF